MYELKLKIEELQAKLDASDELEYRENVYWRASPINGKPNGPFCPRCYESSEKKLSSMSQVTGHATIAGKLDKKPLWGWDGGSNPLVQKFS